MALHTARESDERTNELHQSHHTITFSAHFTQDSIAPIRARRETGSPFSTTAARSRLLPPPEKASSPGPGRRARRGPGTYTSTRRKRSPIRGFVILCTVQTLSSQI